MRTQAPLEVFQVRILLDGIKPPIWRRVLVHQDIMLDDLHQVIQDVMGWGDDHLHAFSVGKQSYGPRVRGETSNTRDERGVPLDSLVANAGDTLSYVYDFGDGWQHSISIEEVFARGDLTSPLCIDGKRACPPEDCGGVPGYERLVRALKNPKSAKNAELLEWLGEDFDPEEFDVDAVNRLLSGQ